MTVTPAPSHPLACRPQDCPDAVSLRAWLNSPWTTSLGQDVFKATNMLATFLKASARNKPNEELSGGLSISLLR